MLLVIAYHPGDFDQAARQAAWIAELDAGLENAHDLILVADTRCNAQLTAAYAKSFASVHLMPFVDHYKSWPSAPNEVFSQVARYIAAERKQPWLFLEPDAIPLKRGWRDDIWAEYEAARKAGKHFLGDLVTAGNSGVNVVTHMSGNAVYPANLYEHAGNVFLAGDLAFDVAAADQIVPQMQTSELIRHSWRAPAFANWEDVQARIFDIKPKACVFHADKSSSLIPLLREHMKGDDAKCPISTMTPGNSDQSAPISEVDSNAAPRSEPERAATCDIFIKSYPKDYPWLEYCLRSVKKFAWNFGQLSVVFPKDAPIPPNIEFLGNRIEAVEYGPNGYLSQQVFKLYADEYTDAEYICYIDSDTIFTKFVTPEMFFTDGKLNWMISPHSTVETPWQEGAQKFLKGVRVEFETMRRFPITCPRWLLADVRKFCEIQHGMPLSEYIMAQEPPEPPVSEFNLLGAYAYLWHADKFNWIDTSQVPESEWPPLVVRQAYSHDGITPEIEKEFRHILTGESTVADDVDAMNEWLVGMGLKTASTAGPPLIATISDQIPWADRQESIAEINRLAKRLKEFQGNHSGRVRFVRMLLQRQGVIELSYRRKKRKGWKRKKK